MNTSTVRMLAEDTAVTAVQNRNKYHAQIECVAFAT